MSSSIPPQYDPYPFVDPRFEELPPPKGFVAQTAGVLSFCVALLPLGAALLLLVSVVAVTANDLKPIDSMVWVTITACLAMAFVGIYGGVQLLERRKAGRWWVVAFAVLCLAQVTRACITGGDLLPAVLAVAPLLILTLAVSGATARWVAWQPLDPSRTAHPPASRQLG